SAAVPGVRSCARKRVRTRFRRILTTRRPEIPPPKHPCLQNDCGPELPPFLSLVYMAIKIKTDREIELIRASCRLAAEVLARAGELVKPGITTDDINTFVHDMTIKAG